MEKDLDHIRISPITGLSMYWVLEGKSVRPATVMEWANSFENSDRFLRQNAYQRHGKQFWISTVFIGLDHGFGGGRPEIFETMVFEGRSTSDLMCERHSTYAEALEAHERMFYQAKIEVLGMKPKFT